MLLEDEEDEVEVDESVLTPAVTAVVVAAVGSCSEDIAGVDTVVVAPSRGCHLPRVPAALPVSSA